MSLRWILALGLFVGACQEEADSLEGTPTADAGPDQTVSAGVEVFLNGTESSAPDGRPLSFLWRQVAGPTVALQGASGPTPRFVAPEASVQLGFELLVSTEAGGTATDEVSIQVRLSLPPVADAGEDRLVGPNSRFELDGSESIDPDGSIVAYTWRQVGGPEVMLDADDRAQVGGLAPNEAGLVVMELRVEDDDGLEDRDQVRLQLASNLPPVADAGPDVDVTGDSFELDGGASFDPDGSIVSYTWRSIQGPALRLIEDRGPSIVAERPVTAILAELQVEDDFGATAVDTVRITPVGRPPQVQVSFPPPTHDFEGRFLAFTMTGRAEDPDGGAIVRVTVAGMEAELDPEVPGRWSAAIPMAYGRGSVEIVAEDEAGEIGTTQFELQNQPAFDEPIQLSVSPDETTALVLDQNVGLIEIGLSSGERNLLFDKSIFEFSQPNGMAVDWSDRVVYLTDAGRRAVGAFDLNTARVRVVSSVDVGTGPDLLTASSPVYDEVNDRLLVSGGFPRAVIAIDLVTGDRTALTLPPMMNGGFSVLGNDAAVAFDRENNRIFYTFSNVLQEIDLDTGLIDFLQLNSLEFRFFRSAHWDPDRELLFVANERLNSYDPETRTFQREVTLGEEPLAGLVPTRSGDGLLAAGDDSILEYDLDALSQSFRQGRIVLGSGPRFTQGFNVLWLEESRRLFFQAGSPFSSTEVLSVDVETGDRETLDQDAFENVLWLTKNGPDLVAVGREITVLDPVSLVGERLDIAPPEAYLTDFRSVREFLIDSAQSTAYLGPFIQRFDLADGSLTEVSGRDFGSGPAFRTSSGFFPFQWRSPGDESEFLVLDFGTLFEVRLSDGRRRVLSGAQRGDGPLLDDAATLRSDPSDPNAAFVTSPTNGVMRIELDSGNRSILASPPQIFSFDLDDRERRLYGVRGNALELSSVVAIDLQTGQWVSISK
ncbi:MAG: hypothetical protein AAF627_17845 [Myxococcota bacterium]